MPENAYSYVNFAPYINNHKRSFTNTPQRDMDGEEDVPGFAYEESRLLKAHLTSEFTRYVNNLKIGARPTPYFYDMMQGVIGYATHILYYSAAPFICQIILDDLESERLPFEFLLSDKFFREFWTENKHTSHDYNAFKGKKYEPVVHDQISKEFYDTITRKIKHPYPLSEVGDSKIISFNSVLNHEVKVILDERGKGPYVLSASDIKVKQRFVDYLVWVGHTCHTKAYRENSEEERINILQGLKTIYILYFKGGNSIREIAERYNSLSSDGLKVDNIDTIIPYGSDFDTNILINPYFPLETFNKIQAVIELFIPQFASLIVIPDELRDKFITPTPADTNGMFIGTKPQKNEQEHQMNIMINSYELNKKYLLAERISKVDKKIKKLNIEPLFTLAPEKFAVTPENAPHIKRSVIIECPNVFDTLGTDCKLSTFKISTSSQFPNDNSPGNPFKNYMTKLDKDYCYNSLQYQLNATIPKFRLHRFFLKFALGKKIQKANHKPRLINIDTKHYNAEALDISIVQPYYTLTTDKKYLACELLELWNDAPDIFKIAVPDTYKLYDFMAAKFTKIGKPGGPAKPKFSVFINGLSMQINDLVEAIKDTLLEKKYEKISKRMLRLRLLRFLQVMSPSYGSNMTTWREITVFNRINNLPIPLNPIFEEIDINHKYAPYYRILYDCYEAHSKCEILAFEGKPIPLIFKKDEAGNYIPISFWDIALGNYVRKIKGGWFPESSESLIDTITSDQATTLKDVVIFNFVKGKNNIRRRHVENLVFVEASNIYYNKIIFSYSVDTFYALCASVFKNENNEYRFPYIFIYLLIKSISILPEEDRSSLEAALPPDMKLVMNKLFNELAQLDYFKVDPATYTNPYAYSNPEYVQHDIAHAAPTPITPENSNAIQAYNATWKYFEIIAGVSVGFKKTYINYLSLAVPFLKLHGPEYKTLDYVYRMMIDDINTSNIFTNPFFGDLLKCVNALLAFFEGVPLGLNDSGWGVRIDPAHPLTFLEHYRMARIVSVSQLDIYTKFFTQAVIKRFLYPIDPFGLTLLVKDDMGYEYQLDHYSVMGDEYYFSENVSKFDSTPYSVVQRENTKTPGNIKIKIFLKDWPEMEGGEVGVTLFSLAYPDAFGKLATILTGAEKRYLHDLPLQMIRSPPPEGPGIAMSNMIIDVYHIKPSQGLTEFVRLNIEEMNKMYQTGSLLYAMSKGILYIFMGGDCLGFAQPYTPYIFMGDDIFYLSPLGGSPPSVFNPRKDPEFHHRNHDGRFIINGVTYVTPRSGGSRRRKTRKGVRKMKKTLKKTRVSRKIKYI